MTRPLVLVLNSGSSSIKSQLVEPASGATAASVTVERIGEAGGVVDHAAGIREIFEQIDITGVAAVGHRVVHGGDIFHEPTLITDDVVAALRELSPLAPLHNPANVTGIDAAREVLPDVPHVAVFDTAFFHTLPEASRTYAIDAKIAARYGIRRYGFHGTSHDYVSAEASAFLGHHRSSINQIVLHLGNGASASAIHHGRAVDT